MPYEVHYNFRPFPVSAYLIKKFIYSKSVVKNQSWTISTTLILKNEKTWLPWHSYTQQCGPREARSDELRHLKGLISGIHHNRHSGKITQNANII